MRRVLLVSITLVIAGCGPPASSATTPTSAPVVPTPITNSSPRPSSVPKPGLNPTPDPATALDAALSAAASHFGVPRDQLQVVQVEPYEWPDSALGCPQPGQMYSQIVTPGFVVVISAGSRQLEYHTDARANVKLCRET